MKIMEESEKLWFAKLQDSVDNYMANKKCEGKSYITAAAGIAKSLKCNAAATDKCAKTFPDDPEAFHECMETVPGCMDGVVDVNWGDLKARHAAIEKVYGGVDLVTDSQWENLAEVYQY